MKLPRPVASGSKANTIRHLADKRKMSQIGSGCFAKVFSRPTLNKVVKVTEDGDKFIRYVKYVGLKNPNPYFPRIHNVVVHNHRTKSMWGTVYNSRYFSIEMEKLIKWSKVPNSVRVKALEKLGCNWIYDLEYPKIKHSSSRWEKEAIVLLRKVWFGNSRDIHKGNVMFRRRGKGYQLVFTDPVA